MPEARQRRVIDAGDWVLGAADAPVTLLEYGDYECSHCARARSLLEGLVEEDPQTVRLVFRHFPVTVSHPHAALAAEAAECAGAQGRFWQMHDMIYSNQPDLEYEDLRWCADALGLDLLRFDDELKAHLYRGEVRRDFQRGVRDGVNGTPTIFLNGRRYDGPRERSAMIREIAALMPQARLRDLHLS
jgi:protein-disulfide isomerase